MEEALEQPKKPSLWDKAARQCRKHPLIPTGMAATVGALTMALKRMQQRDAVGYQRWLRARVVAQGLTIVAIIVAGVQEMGPGVLYGNARPATPPPTSPWESAQFEKRLKEAEEAHNVETSVTPSNVRSAASPVPKASPIVQAAEAAVPPPQTNSSSWSSWFGVGKN
ncbi:RCF1 [Sanghuangporus sanghuang]